ncbi:MAG: UDP-galactopyranose mutase [Mycoplasmoidaceae bacterium]
MNKEIIIIGAGLAGCTIARLLADNSHKIKIFEEKNHKGGNLYDFYNNNGILIHKYGPHIFHTSYDDVWKFVNRFSKFNNYKNQVLVKLTKKSVKLPINLDGIKELFPKEFEVFNKEIKDKKLKGEAVSILNLLNTLESKESKKIVNYVYENVYAKYTAKMWGKSIDQLPKFILERVKINLNKDWNYFPLDKYQGLPIDGYTKMLEKMIDDKNIKIEYNRNIIDELVIKKNKIYFEGKEVIVFYTGMIDRFFKFKYGELEYRSLNIKFENHNVTSFQDTAVVNYPLHKTMTRITEYKKMTFQDKKNITTISKEYPGKYDKNDKVFHTPFYPINDDKNQKILNKYLKQANKIENFYLVGRLAEYKYYDMDDIIFECIKNYKEF